MRRSRAIPKIYSAWAHGILCSCALKMPESVSPAHMAIVCIVSSSAAATTTTRFGPTGPFRSQESLFIFFGSAPGSFPLWFVFEDSLG
ncbi:Protein of unknown function [Gryllus bimaculatus]|nr:Protein of unknown function [Gryllus bimaculatus]